LFKLRFQKAIGQLDNAAQGPRGAPRHRARQDVRKERQRRRQERAKAS
jgi:hypothetical protein